MSMNYDNLHVLLPQIAEGLSPTELVQKFRKTPDVIDYVITRMPYHDRMYTDAYFFSHPNIRWIWQDYLEKYKQTYVEHWQAQLPRLIRPLLGDRGRTYNLMYMATDFRNIELQENYEFAIIPKKSDLDANSYVVRIKTRNLPLPINFDIPGNNDYTMRVGQRSALQDTSNPDDYGTPRQLTATLLHNALKAIDPYLSRENQNKQEHVQGERILEDEITNQGEQYRVHATKSTFGFQTVDIEYRTNQLADIANIISNVMIGISMALPSIRFTHSTAAQPVDRTWYPGYDGAHQPSNGQYNTTIA